MKLRKIITAGFISVFFVFAFFPVPAMAADTDRSTEDLDEGVAWPTEFFKDNGDGTVIDTRNGLVWLKDAGCLKSCGWAKAQEVVKTLAHGKCGLKDNSKPGDWRVPNSVELQGLLDFNSFDIDAPSECMFINIKEYYYWTSDADTGDTDGGNPRAWNVYVYGIPYSEVQTAELFVWPVRGGK